jgi:hypothetical protein
MAILDTTTYEVQRAWRIKLLLIAHYPAMKERSDELKNAFVAEQMKTSRDNNAARNRALKEWEDFVNTSVNFIELNCFSTTLRKIQRENSETDK